MMTLSCCYGCGKPILERFLLTVLDKQWHVDCVRCHHCQDHLDQKCFFRDGNIFCREVFYRSVPIGIEIVGFHVLLSSPLCHMYFWYFVFQSP